MRKKRTQERGASRVRETVPRRRSVKKSPAQDLQKLASEGEKIYLAHAERLERAAKGRVVAIDPASGDLFVGDSDLDAYDRAVTAHPGKLFYFRHIGPWEPPGCLMDT